MKTGQVLAMLAAAVATTATAMTWEVAVWRGETTAVRVPGFATNPVDGFTNPPEGVSVRFGSVRLTPWTDEPDWADGKELKQTYDRVVWGAAVEPGPRMMEVTASRDAKPGRHVCGSTVIRVVDRELPPVREWKYFLDLWQHPWAVARHFGVKPFSPEHYEKMRPLWRELAQAGQKALTVTMTDLPWNHQCYDAYHSMIGRTKNDDGSWSFDYTTFDAYVAFGRACGIGPDIACYTMCPWGYEVYYQDAAGARKSLQAKPDTPAFEDFWGDFLVDFKRHLEQKGWFADAYIAMDERSPEDVSAITKFIQRRAPGFKVAMAGNRKPSEFKGITIDNYSQVLEKGFVTEAFRKELDERRAKGYTTTFYVCCWPPRPNTLMANPTAEAFWLGVYPAIGGYDGQLRWAYNSWPFDPCRNAAYGNWAAGDTFLAYPDGEPSVRFLELKRGIVAAEKIRILREKGLFVKEIDEVAKKFSLAEANDGKADMRALREAVLGVVNR